MPKSIFQTPKIQAIATCVPKNSINIDDMLYSVYNGDEKKLNRVKKSVGLEKLHLAKSYTTASDLCEIAANDLLSNSGISKDKIDAIIMVTQTPDFFAPATAAYLHGRLNLKQDCAMFDINQGCAGYIYGLQVAFMLIETKSAKNVLLCAGDCNYNKSNNPATILFGDCGSATIISSSNTKSYFSIYSDGKNFDVIITPNGAYRTQKPNIFNNPKIIQTKAKDIYMDGAKVFEFTMEKILPIINEILEISNKQEKDIDLVILHQSNKMIMEMIAKKINFPIPKVPNTTISKYGNTSVSSIPLCICDTINQRNLNQKLNLVCCGYGIGLSWGACQLELDNIYCPQVLFYDE